MKAVLVREFAPFERADFCEIADPEPEADEVVIDVVGAEANYPDILMMEGRYQVKPPLPFSPGKVASGLVSAVGANVSGLKIGDAVTAYVEYGAYAEKVRASAETCFPMPSDMPFEVGAALGLVYQTAHFALAERAGLKPGERVLVLGASGGIGSASVQLAKAMGASAVLGGVMGEQNVAVARSIGCDHVIDMGMDDLRDGLRAAVHAATGGKGVDVVVDPVGGEANGAALRTLDWCGRLVVIGFASGDIPTIKANYLLLKNISVLGLQWSDYPEHRPEQVRAVQAEIHDLWRKGKIKPLISRTLPLSRYAEALSDLRDGKAQGKIVLMTNQ